MPRTSYYSDGIQGSPPRVKEEVPPTVWGGIVQLINTRLADGSFGAGFPQPCPRCSSIPNTVGADADGFGLALQAEIPGIPWPLEPEEIPPTLTILDVIEFCHDHIAQPRELRPSLVETLAEIPGLRPGHPVHLRFDKEAGQARLRADVDRIFRRNGIAYELTQDGDVQRIPPQVLREAVTLPEFDTGDSELDALLETARRKYLDKDPERRGEALEKLWDAFERLKTLEVPGDKKQSVRALIDEAARTPEFGELLNDESKALTDVGNDFMIRHTEVGTAEVPGPDHQEYLFHRLWALMRFLLRGTGRWG